MSAISRRGFLGAGAGFWIAPRARSREKLRIACIGVGGRGSAAVQAAKAEALVALCDVDDRTLGKAAAQNPDARTYHDYRELIDAERDLDAVIVSTPDQHHALASYLALRKGRHVYCEKLMARTVAEARLLAETAAGSKAVTQEGTQGHATDARRQVVEMLRTGVVGPVAEVHAWSNRPIWPAGLERPAAGMAVPDGLQWDLWLGPAPERPYHSAYVPFKWRGWWDYSSGAVSDMASHHLDAAFWALQPGSPTQVAAEGEPLHPDSTPRWLTARWEFPARGERPAFKLFWYDGQKKPPAEVLDGVPAQFASGTVFVGRDGRLVLESEQGAKWRLLPEAKFAGYAPPEPSLPRVPGQNQYAEWIAACKGEGKALLGFEAAAPMTEAILLAAVAFRTGKALDWDGAALRARNAPEAQKFVQGEARKGWTLPSRPGIRMYK
jgi:predicted dehydrogenase